jgi:hypothetical protein
VNSYTCINIGLLNANILIQLLINDILKIIILKKIRTIGIQGTAGGRKRTVHRGRTDQSDRDEIGSSVPESVTTFSNE